MNLAKTTAKTNPLYVGAYISQSECESLTANFKQNFPAEVTSVNIKRSVIESLLDDERVSGIRFMFGLDDKDDASSRVIILMPCSFTMLGNIPNVIFNKDGFYANNGQLLSLNDACAKQVNHVFRLKSQNPELAYTKILRGYFMGKAALLQLVEQVADEEVVYKFGYDHTPNGKFKPVLQPINSDDGGFDHGKLCPPDNDCGDSSDLTCVATYVAQYYVANHEADLNILRGFRDLILHQNEASAAIEKYYTIFASVMERINQDTAKAQVAEKLYHDYFKTSVASVLANDKEGAFKLFEECMQFLTDKYLYQ